MLAGSLTKQSVNFNSKPALFSVSPASYAGEFLESGFKPTIPNLSDFTVFYFFIPSDATAVVKSQNVELSTLTCTIHLHVLESVQCTSDNLSYFERTFLT